MEEGRQPCQHAAAPLLLPSSIPAAQSSGETALARSRRRGPRPRPRRSWEFVYPSQGPPPRTGKGLCVTERREGSSPRLRAQPEHARRRMPPLRSQPAAAIGKQKSQGGKTLARAAIAAPTNTTPPKRQPRGHQQRRAQPPNAAAASRPRRCLLAAPREAAHPGSPLSGRRHRQPKPRADGEHRIARRIGDFEPKLPYQPSRRPRAGIHRRQQTAPQRAGRS